VSTLLVRKKLLVKTLSDFPPPKTDSRSGRAVFRKPTHPSHAVRNTSCVSVSFQDFSTAYKQLCFGAVTEEEDKRWITRSLVVRRLDFPFPLVCQVELRSLCNERRH